MAGIDDNFLLQLAEDVSYVGFSTSEFRRSLITKGWTSDDIAKALTIYVIMGNNAGQEKRINKAANSERAREMTNWLSGKGVVKSVGTRQVITLGRIAKAFAPMLKEIRTVLKSKIRIQVDTTTPVELCDVAFLGYNETECCRGCDDYISKFGLIIGKVGNPGLTDAQLLKRQNDLAAVAKQALDSDPVMKTLLGNKFNDKQPLLLALFPNEAEIIRAKVPPAVPLKKEAKTSGAKEEPAT
jgi:hypothetical protein